MRLPLALILPASLLLVSCGTPEYQAERSVCQAEWEQKIPARMGQRLVERSRYIRVPTGEMICEPVGKKGGQHCVSGTRLEEIPYTTLESYDMNKARRDVQIRACAVQACSVKFGNPECKVPKAAP